MLRSAILKLSLLAVIVSLLFLTLNGYRNANLIQLLSCFLLFVLAFFAYARIKKKWCQ